MASSLSPKTRRPRTLHQRLLQSTRRVVFADPQMHAEYQRRHRWRWVPDVLLVVASVSTLSVLGHLAVYALYYLWWLELPYEMVWSRDVVPPPEEKSPRFLVVMLLMGAGAAILACLMPGCCCVCWNGALQAHLPHDDRWHLNASVRPLRNAAIGLACVVPFFLAFIPPGVPPAALWLAIALGALAPWQISTLAILASVYGPRRVRTSWSWLAWVVWTGFGILSIVLVNLKILELPIMLLHYLLPWGWVAGAIDFALVRGEVWGWAFLIPVAITEWLAQRWLRRGYEIAEFEGGVRFTSGVPNRQWLSDCRWEWLKRLWPEPPAARSPPVDYKRVLNAEWRGPQRFPRLAFVEPWVMLWLNPREQRWLGKHAGMSVVLVVCSLFATVVCGLALLTGRADFRVLWGFGGLTFFMFEMLLVGIGPGQASIHPHWPIDYREHRWFWFKVTLARLPLWLMPLAMILTLVVGSPWEELHLWLRESARLTVLLMTTMALHVCCFASTEPRWSRHFIVDCLALFPLGLCVLGQIVCVPLAIAGDLPDSFFWSVQGGYLLSLWLVLARFDYRYHSTVYDVEYLSRRRRLHRHRPTVSATAE